MGIPAKNEYVWINITYIYNFLSEQQNQMLMKNQIPWKKQKCQYDASTINFIQCKMN